MKIYVVYMRNHFIPDHWDPPRIVGHYSSKEKAKKKRDEILKKDRSKNVWIREIEVY